MATAPNNSTNLSSDDQGILVHQTPMFPIALVAAVVCGVLVGLFLGWATLEATSRARFKCGNWCRKKVGLKTKHDRTKVTPCESAIWNLEKGHQTPKLNTPNFNVQTSESLPPSFQDTLVTPVSTSGAMSLHYSGGDGSKSTKAEAGSAIMTPPPKAQSVISAASSPYSYYNADDLSTPKAPMAILEGKPSLDVDATPTKGAQQASVTVPRPVYTKLNRF